MAPKLYLTEMCPSARSILMTAKILDLTLELKELYTIQEDIPTKILKQLSSQYTVPVLEDHSYIIWDSHAIIAYLVGKYGQNDSLYPRDIYTRSLIDERLDFDTIVISFFTKTILNPILYENINTITEEQVNDLNRMYTMVEKFLDENMKWIAGDSLTIADLSLIPSITSLNTIVKIDKQKYPKIIEWIRRAELLSCYAANQNGLQKLQNFLKSKMLKFV